MKQNKRLILHIGMNKAGSSSIQQSLGRSREILLVHNIYYPNIRPYNHIISFTPIFVEDPETIDCFKRTLRPSEDKATKVQVYRDAWLKEFDACNKDHFIISAEYLSTPYFPEDAVSRLKAFIEPYFKEVTIIAYIRHYDTWIASQIQEQIKIGVATGDIKEIVQHYFDCPPWASYSKSLKKWLNVFGRDNIIIRPFDSRAFYNGSLLTDFFHSCNLPVDKIPVQEIRKNESVGQHAISFLQEYNQSYPVFINNSVNTERGYTWRLGIPIDLYKNLKDEKFELGLIYSPEQAEKFNMEIDFVNQFFADGYQFKRVSSKTGELIIPRSEDIPVEFFVELINNYNKRLGDVQERNETQQIKIKELRQQNRDQKKSNVSLQNQIQDLQKRYETLWEQNAHSQKIMNVLKIPLFLRAINKLPFVKKVFQRITGW